MTLNFMIEETSELQTNSSSSIHPPPNRPTKTSHKSRYERDKPNQQPTQIQEIVHRILNDGSYDGVTRENCQQVAAELQKFQNALQMKSMYMKADEVDKCIQKVKSYQTSTKYITLQTQRAVEYSELLDNTKNDNTDIMNQWSVLIKNAEDQRDSEIAELQQSFVTELEIFDQHFEEPPPTKFLKFSTKYIDLRQRQKIMATSDHFLEAKEIKKLADELEQQERVKQKENWIQYLEQTREGIIREQERKMRTKVAAWEKTINQMKNQSKSEMMHGKRSEDYLTNKINSAISDLDVEVDLEYERNKSRMGEAELEKSITSKSRKSLGKSQSNESSVSMAKTGSLSTRIIRPLSEKEIKFKQRKKANFITYTKTFSSRNSRK